MNTDKGKTDQPLSCFPDDVSSHLPGVRFTPVGNKNSFLGRKTVAFCSPLDRKTLECSAEELNTCILSNGNGWISALDEAGLTPLHRFSRSNHVEIVRTLLELGGEVNVRGFGDMTPLHLASRSNSTETVELLLQHGADPCLQTESQMSALHLATRAGNKAIVQSLLRAPNTAVNARNKADVTSLHLACGRGFMEVCEMLLRNGAKVDVRTIEGVTPLSFAARNVDAGIASLILEEAIERHVDVDQLVNNEDCRRCTPLHSAARFGSLAVTELLLQHGARGDAVNEQGQTPLHLASICGMTQVVGKLISAGACANRADTLHRTPLHWCVIRGFRTCYS